MGGDPSSGGYGRVDSDDCSPAGSGPQDGAAMPAADGVEAVRAGGTVGDAADRAHAEYLRRRASAVDYSAQVLFQELQRREYRGSYETVNRFVRPLREARLHAAVTRTRFETPPGLQSQIDWGQARIWFGTQREVRHIFVLTFGFSRRSVYVPVPHRLQAHAPRSARRRPALPATSRSPSAFLPLARSLSPYVERSWVPAVFGHCR